MCRRLLGARLGSEEEASRGSHWDLSGIRRAESAVVGSLMTASEPKGSGLSRAPTGSHGETQQGHHSAHSQAVLVSPSPLCRWENGALVAPSHPLQPFGCRPHHSPGWPPGPGTGGCGDTGRRPSGSSVAGAQALAPALAQAPGPARSLALLWAMKGRRAPCSLSQTRSLQTPGYREGEGSSRLRRSVTPGPTRL